MLPLLVLSHTSAHACTLFARALFPTTPSFARGAMGAFVRANFQVRELSAAVLRLATPAASKGVITALDALHGAPGGLQPVEDSEDVGLDMFQVTKLVLKDVDVADYALPLPPTPEGAEMLAALQVAVYGSNSCVHPSLMQAVLCGSLIQARRMLHFCAAALLDLLSPSNCLAIYNVAAAARCSRLSAAARGFALRHFAVTAQQDYTGLTGLQPSDLMAFLRSDALQVTSELEVFFALAAWVEFEPATRMRGFARRLAAAVRLPQLSTSDLMFLDSHPLVLKDRMALQVVAHTYLSKVVGLPSDAPFGMETIAHPRRSQQQHQQQQLASPAAASEGGQGGSRSALAEAVQSCLAADRRAWGPGTPAALPATDVPVAAAQREDPPCGLAAPLSLEVLLAAAATPALRCASEAKPQAAVLTAAGSSRARHVEVATGAAARRSLFSVGVAGSSSTCLCQEEGGAFQALQSKFTAQAEEAQVAPAAAAAPFEAAGRVSGLRVDMMISPTKVGIRRWLDAAEAAPPPVAWGSKKRLRYE